MRSSLLGLPAAEFIKSRFPRLGYWRRVALALVALVIPMLFNGDLPRERALPPLGADWVPNTQRHILEREYWASRNEHGLQAPNSAHGLRTYFDGHGIRVVDGDEGSGLAEFRLSGIGRADAALRPVPPGDLVHEGPRVEIRRPGIVEWYVNTAAGLEQGFTLGTRPTADGPLVLELVVEGALARLDGDAIVLTSAAGRGLRYGALAVYDATGAAVAARFAVPAPGRVQIVVDDGNAAYPLVVDPLITGEGFAAALLDVTSFLFCGGEKTYLSPVGDSNGDGYDDVIVSATGYLFLGGPGGIGDRTAEDADACCFTGAAGDVNGDGYDDLLSGGELYLGNAAGIPTRGASTLADTAAGDVNGDGYGDLMVTAGDDVRVYHGTAAGVPTLATRIGPPSISFNSVSAAGDVNGDGYGDIVVGDMVSNLIDVDSDGIIGPDPLEVARVFHGGPSGIPNATPNDANTVLQDHECSYLIHESAGDVNGDGYDDVVLGRLSGFGPSGCGPTVFHGSASGIAEGTPAVWLPYWFADPRAAGDVNSDGYDDLIVSYPTYSGGQDQEGAAYVFLGSSSGLLLFGEIGLESNEDRAVFSHGTAGGPSCVGGAGDVNGDGRDDVAVSDWRGSKCDGYWHGPGEFEEVRTWVFHGSTCGNGMDDDGDGLVDFPTDPGCSAAADLSERGGACDDGIDNDGDGFGDFPADPGCTRGRDQSERGGACDDGADNDGDTRIDYPSDPGCSSLIDTSERGTAACDNGIDDDGDGRIDYPSDRGCSSLTDTSERGTAGCDNGVDDDGDGWSDYPADPQCSSPTDVEQHGQCDDWLDNDGDGFVDYPSDPQCASRSDQEQHGQCDDRVDNDGDGRIDFPSDPGCSSALDPSETSFSPPPDLWGCGLGPELALLLAPLGWRLRRREAALHHE